VVSPKRWFRGAVPVRPRLVDAGLALALTVWALAEPQTFSDAGRVPVLVAMTAAIAWARAAPLVVLAVEVAGVVALPNHLELPQGVAFLIAAYSAALYSDRRVAVAILLITSAAWLFAFAGELKIPSGVAPLLLVAPVWLAGSAMRRREHRAAVSAERADRLEREQEESLRAERARIARELHDLVTHSVSVMVLQTGAARQIMSKDEPRSRSMLESVEASGRSALEELRRLLGLLSDGDGTAPLSPQPGLTEIPSLVEQVRQAGVDVELSVEGHARELPGGASITAYRIVQEALTNVVKHARGAPARVVIRWADAGLDIEILDDGPRQPVVDGAARTGRGLAGMRERAAMYGGSVDAGPGPAGGYVVRGHIPLEPYHA
jgi:signal transduction histidine kinase